MKVGVKQVMIAAVFMIAAQAFPDSFAAFRETVYLQNKNLSETMRLYTAAKHDIETSFAEADLYVTLSRCEYLMGITLRAGARDDEAAAYFERGIAWAEAALKLCPSSEAYQLLGTNIAFLCDVRRSYGLKNYNKIEESAKKALELDPDNLAARYLIAAQYVVAPWPLTNIRKGAALLEEITRQNYLSMEKEDLFNLYLMLEAASLKQKKPDEAKIWREKCTELYPGNNFISLLVKGDVP